jgi:hypothetical protein
MRTSADASSRRKPSVRTTSSAGRKRSSGLLSPTNAFVAKRSSRPPASGDPSWAKASAAKRLLAAPRFEDQQALATRRPAAPLRLAERRHCDRPTALACSSTTTARPGALRPSALTRPARCVVRSAQKVIDARGPGPAGPECPNALDPEVCELVPESVQIVPSRQRLRVGSQRVPTTPAACRLSFAYERGRVPAPCATTAARRPQRNPTVALLLCRPSRSALSS